MSLLPSSKLPTQVTLFVSAPINAESFRLASGSMLASTTQTIIIYDSKTNRNCAATHYLMCLREIRSVPKAPPRPISQPSPYFGTLASAALQVISVPKMIQPTKRSGDHPSPHRRTSPKAGQSQSCDLRSTLVQCITVLLTRPPRQS